MATREIPPEEWAAFFARFSEEHPEWPAMVELVGLEVGNEPVTRTEPLAGIVVDTKGSERGGIDVLLIEGNGEHLTHRIPAPRHVWYRDASDEAGEAVEIQSEGGACTFIHFSSGTFAELAAAD